MEKQHRIRTDDRVIVRVSGIHGKVRVKYRIKINQNKKGRRRRTSRRRTGTRRRTRRRRNTKKKNGKKRVSVDPGEGSKSNVSVRRRKRTAGTGKNRNITPQD